jgi:putative transposase
MFPKICRNFFCKSKVLYITNKGVDNIKIFSDDYDYLRFVYYLLVFNNKKRTKSVRYDFLKNFNKVCLEDKKLLRKNEENLVEILGFVLTPDEFDLILRSKSEENIAFFIQKICAAYALYFNKKYKRKGPLFEGKYKFYILRNFNELLNSINFINSKQLNLETKDDVLNFDFLKNYRWSTYIDYCGWNNFPAVIDKNFIFDFLNGPENYKKYFYEWLKNKNFEKLKSKKLPRTNLI